MKNKLERKNSRDNIILSKLTIGHILKLSVLTVLLTIVGCSSDEEGSTNSPTGNTSIPFDVATVAPATGTSSISVFSEVTATFTKDLDPTSVTSSSFMIAGISGSYSASCLQYLS